MTELVCDACARRTWLLEMLEGHLEPVRSHIDELLTLGDEELIEAVGGRYTDTLLHHLECFDAAHAAAERDEAEIYAVCRCRPEYPRTLRDLPTPPAVLHMTRSPRYLASLLDERPVAIVGTRRASAYGRETARALARELAATGLTVVSGLALGIDGAAHQGALAAARASIGNGTTIAVVPGGLDCVYPASHRGLRERIERHGLIVSEFAPGAMPRRWTFPARNRIIAALSEMTVVVQAGEGSGALLTADWAHRLGRPVGAVPGLRGAPLSAGPHQLLRDGARLIAGPQDVLDGLYGDGAMTVACARRDDLDPALKSLFDALADGEEQSAAFARAGLDVDSGLAALAALELAGFIRRTAGGRYAAI